MKIQDKLSQAAEEYAYDAESNSVSTWLVGAFFAGASWQSQQLPPAPEEWVSIQEHQHVLDEKDARIKELEAQLAEGGRWYEKYKSLCDRERELEARLAEELTEIVCCDDHWIEGEYQVDGPNKGKTLLELSRDALAKLKKRLEKIHNK